MNTDTTPPAGRPAGRLPGRAPGRNTAMNPATVARIAAWRVIADQELPAGTKVTVKDGEVTIHPRGRQPAHVHYSPADTLESLYDSLKGAAQAAAQDTH